MAPNRGEPDGEIRAETRCEVCHRVGGAIVRHTDAPEELRFDRFMDRALYEPGSGFYATSGRPGGHRGDFLTSPTLGPLFGGCVAALLDREWEHAGRPDHWMLEDHGAGGGQLTRAVLAARPRCRAALSCRVIERSAAGRARHAELIGRAASQGISVESLADSPAGPVSGLIVANELLDNLAFRWLRGSPGAWEERWVVRGRGGWEERWRPVESDVVPRGLFGPEIPDGDRAVEGSRSGEAPFPLVQQASGWVSRQRERLVAGRLVVIDYGAPTTGELRRRGDWCRTYRDHGVGTDPLVGPGTVDITTDVPFDQLPPPRELRTQREALVDWGLAALVEAARRSEEATRGRGDLEWARSRSVLAEAPVLCDPEGFGGFLVAEYTSR